MLYKRLTNKESERVLVAITTRGNDINKELVIFLLQLVARYPRIYLTFFQSHLCAYLSQFNMHKYVLEHPRIEYVLMIDSDVAPHPWSLEMLYAHKKDIIAAPVWHQEDGGSVHINIHPKSSAERLVNVEGKSGIEEIRHCSMGTTLIHRRVFDAFPDEPLYSQKNQPFHLHHAPTDVLFTHKVRSKGFKIWVNWDIKGCGHWNRVRLDQQFVKHIKETDTYKVTEWRCAE